MELNGRGLLRRYGLIAGWAAACAAGIGALADYSLAPGEASAVSARWPVDSGLLPAADRPTLILAAHPQCPCTRATLDELAIIRAQAGDRLEIRVLFVDLAGVETRGSLWRQAAAIPGVEPLVDPGGRTAASFGAKVSGHAMVYAPDGRLLYSGGLTPARGHAGYNRGRSAVLAISRGAAVEPHASVPALGCGLRGPPRESP